MLALKRFHDLHPRGGVIPSPLSMVATGRVCWDSTKAANGQSTIVIFFVMAICIHKITHDCTRQMQTDAHADRQAHRWQCALKFVRLGPRKERNGSARRRRLSGLEVHPTTRGRECPTKDEESLRFFLTAAPHNMRSLYEITVRAIALSRHCSPNLPAALNLASRPRFSSSTSAPWVRHVGEGALLLRFGTEIDVGVNTKAHTRVRLHSGALERGLHSYAHARIYVACALSDTRVRVHGHASASLHRTFHSALDHPSSRPSLRLSSDRARLD